jgi:2'-5' RNA ligase
VRLFVQVRPSPEAAAHLRSHLGATRTSNPDQWHITLAFLGEVPAVEPLSPGLRDAAARHDPFDLRLAGSGSFGRRATWVGVGGDVAALRALAAAVQAACRDAGVDLERRAYRPHLTVGRLDPVRLSSYDGPGFRVDRIELVRSLLGKRAVHTVLESFLLGYQA